MRKSKVFDGSEPRLALYSSLITHTFAVFGKSRKLNAKSEHKSRGFWSKNRSWAPQGRLILPFLSIFGDSKTRCFFDADSGGPKISKNRPPGVKFQFHAKPLHRFLRGHIRASELESQLLGCTTRKVMTFPS